MYKRLIQDMVKDHELESKRRSSLIISNSFDSVHPDIEDYLEQRGIYVEVFLIDALRKEEREDYL